MTLPAQTPDTVRTMQPGDIPQIAIIAASEATAPHWPVTEYHRMLQVIAENPQRRGAWVVLATPPQAAVPQSTPTTSRSDSAAPPLPSAAPPCSLEYLHGFSMASHVAGICELEAVVVRAAARSQGFGTQLIQAVAAWGQALGATRLELEVRPSNTPALRLYQRLGFTHDGTRPAYYHNPEEDAVLMSLDLSAR